jgi:two-component system, OmpR family, response regulator
VETIIKGAVIHNAFIIDDEKDICYLLSNMLRQKAIKTESASTLGEAMIALEGKDPEIIFLDNHLPDGLGVNFIKRLKHDHPLSKIIMVTAHDTASDRSKAMNEGADYFMGKPFSREAVNEALDSFRD